MAPQTTPAPAPDATPDAPTEAAAPVQKPRGLTPRQLFNAIGKGIGSTLGFAWRHKFGAALVGAAVYFGLPAASNLYKEIQGPPPRPEPTAQQLANREIFNAKTKELIAAGKLPDPTASAPPLTPAEQRMRAANRGFGEAYGKPTSRP